MAINSVAGLRSFFGRLGAGGFTSAETRSLLDRVAKNGVTHSERRNLRALLVSGKSLFSREDWKTTQGFLAADAELLFRGEKVRLRPPGARELPMPALMKKDKGRMHAEWVAGSLWGADGPKPEDVVQGMLGDCYLLAAFMCMAHGHPEELRRLIRDNGDGTYTVQLLERSGRSRKPVEVTVDGRLWLTAEDALIYSQGGGKLWVPILEKAFAQWRGSYQAIGTGADVNFALSAFTGRTGTFQWLYGYRDVERTYARIEEALRRGKLVSAATYADPDDKLYPGTGMVPSHAYAVLGAYEKNGKKTLLLRNPWRELEPAGNGADDGLFELEASVFLDRIGVLEIS